MWIKDSIILWRERIIIALNPYQDVTSLVAQTVKCLPTMQETWVGKIPWRRQWHPTPVLLPGKSHGQRSVVGYSPWCHKESDMTERLHYTTYQGLGDSTQLASKKSIICLNSFFKKRWISSFDAESQMRVKQTQSSDAGMSLCGDMTDVLCGTGPEVQGLLINKNIKELSNSSAPPINSIFITYDLPGEGNGNPLQYSCMENPRDRGAWWAAIYGVAQSRTQLKQLSSSRYLSIHLCIFMSFMAYRGSSQLKDRTQVSHIAGGFFTIWATREALTRKSLFYPNLYYILVSCTHTILL